MTQENILIVRINDKCGPIDRGDIYEDPLDEALQKALLGEVIGAGSQLNENFKVEYCELEVSVTADLEKTKQFIIHTLSEIGIPKGSKIIDGPNEIEFGNKEVMAVSFSNLLEEAVYEKNDINDVLDKFHQLLGDHGEMANHRSTHDETIVYFQGNSFEKMKALISPYWSTNALCVDGKIFQEA